MTTQEAVAMATEVGFSHGGELNVAELKFMPEIRDMCKSNRCRAYGKSWVCPPQCGTLEEITARASRYGRGILVQSTGEMEDDFDVECMQETEQLHKQRFLSLVQQLRSTFPALLPMSAGTCTVCESCAYPDAPCRFPDKAFTSMEAYGLFVSDVCAKSGLPYYYGPKTITYTSCILLD